LDPRTRGRSIDRTVRQVIGGADQLALYRRWATLAYRQMIDDATEAGAFFAANYAEEIAGRPVAASLLVFLGELPLSRTGGPIGLEEMVADLGQPGLGEEMLDPPRLVDLRVGEAVRVRGRTEAEPPESSGRQATVDVTRFFVPKQQWDRLLVISFSTAMLALSDVLADLFDRVAQSVRWQI
jgi:hypothetical protein